MVLPFWCQLTLVIQAKIAAKSDVECGSSTSNIVLENIGMYKIILFFEDSLLVLCDVIYGC